MILSCQGQSIIQRRIQEDGVRVIYAEKHRVKKLLTPFPGAAIAQLRAAGETVTRIGEIRAREGDEAQTIVM
jgi:hypothetical protein